MRGMDPQQEAIHTLGQSGIDPLEAAIHTDIRKGLDPHVKVGLTW